MRDHEAPLSASLEDYLEAIFWVEAKKGAARAKDIARALGVRAASVTGALRALAERRYINYAPYEVITLTRAGCREAEKIVQKHEVLKGFFRDLLGLEEKLAEEGACRLEHGLPEPVMERLLAFTEFVQACPRCGDDWRRRFLGQCVARVHPPCGQCVKDCLASFQDGRSRKKETAGQPLARMRPGTKCVVQRVRNPRTAARRLVEMGLRRGTVIHVERVAPQGDPIAIKVRGCRLVLRREEARAIEVAPA